MAAIDKEIPDIFTSWENFTGARVEEFIKSKISENADAAAAADRRAAKARSLADVNALDIASLTGKTRYVQGRITQLETEIAKILQEAEATGKFSQSSLQLLQDMSAALVSARQDIGRIDRQLSLLSDTAIPDIARLQDKIKTIESYIAQHEFAISETADLAAKNAALISDHDMAIWNLSLIINNIRKKTEALSGELQAVTTQLSAGIRTLTPIVLSEEQFEALEKPDADRIYYIYED